MRLHIANNIKKGEYLLHSDMFNTNRFPVKGTVINSGLGESNLLNIAAGLASQNNTVWIYGVCGFIIHRYEQMKFSIRDFGSKKGKIIIFNAGKIGYSGLGAGHVLDDDYNIMKCLDILYYAPKDLDELKAVLKLIDSKDTGVFYIQLGEDYDRNNR